MAKKTHSEMKSADPLRKWHRLFGLLLTDHLEGSPFTVELEKDLSQKQQFLDVVVVRQGPGELSRPLPDGLDNFVAHNLISFKSHREPLDDWALKELTGHYVNYRKQVSPRAHMLAEEQFRLYAVCARYPRDLFTTISPEPVQCRRGSSTIRGRALPNSEKRLKHHRKRIVQRISPGGIGHALHDRGLQARCYP